MSCVCGLMATSHLHEYDAGDIKKYIIIYVHIKNIPFIKTPLKIPCLLPLHHFRYNFFFPLQKQTARTHTHMSIISIADMNSCAQIF